MKSPHNKKKRNRLKNKKEYDKRPRTNYKHNGEQKTRTNDRYFTKINKRKCANMLENGMAIKIY
jgi:hypothetical protein